MTNRIHPKTFSVESTKTTKSASLIPPNFLNPPPPPATPPATPPTTLTVWKKSLLFNCKGFTVFDSDGNLIFRVDKYDKSNKGEIILMNGTGNPLLTIRRKKLSLGIHCEIYNGDESTNPRFSLRKHVNFLHPASMIQVICSDSGAVYEIEGSYAQRCFAVYDEKRMVLAEIRPKEEVSGVQFGLDVFRLVIRSGFDAAVAMAFVVSLEEMFGSRSLGLMAR